MGNYRAPVDVPKGEGWGEVFVPPPPPDMDKTERDYYKAAKNKATAGEAIRRARKANAGR